MVMVGNKPLPLYVQAAVVVVVVCLLATTAKTTRLSPKKVRVSHDAAVHLSASPALLQRSGEWADVAWNGVGFPSSDDWIGVYSPADANVSTTAPIKYKFANESSGHLKTGMGSVRFRLINMRADYTFHFFRGGLTQPTITATSNKVSFNNYNEPMQGRLILTNRQDEIRVMWTTRDAVQPQVKFGTAPDKYDKVVYASTSTYRKDQMCGEPASTDGWRDPGLLHSAVLSALRPDTRYYYVYGDPSYGFSPETHFVSAPLANQSDREIRLFAFGDMGKSTQDGSKEHWDNELASINTTTLIAKDMAHRQFDLLLHIGDISYAVGYGSQWDEFHDQVAPIATRLPYMTCIGNHERDYPNSGSIFDGTDSGGECGIAYEMRFPMPAPAKDQPWYSFNYGPIHFVFMSTEHSFKKGSTQWLWIEQDLVRMDRAKTPWVVFSGHRPMYLDSQAEDDLDQAVARELRANLEDLLLKYRVDLALWGHHHSYQRTCPVYQETCAPVGHAPTHVIIGMGGFLLSGISPRAPKWVQVANNKEYGYSSLMVTPTTLEMKFISSLDGLVKDSFTLRK